MNCSNGNYGSSDLAQTYMLAQALASGGGGGGDIKVEKVDELPETGDSGTIYLLDKSKEFYCMGCETEFPKWEESNSATEHNMTVGQVFNSGSNVKSEYLGNGEFLLNGAFVNSFGGTTNPQTSNAGIKIKNFDSNIDYVFSYEIVSGTISSTTAYDNLGTYISINTNIQREFSTTEVKRLRNAKTTIDCSLTPIKGYVILKYESTPREGEYYNYGMFIPSSSPAYTFTNAVIRLNIFPRVIPKSDIYATYIYDKESSNWVNLGNDDFSTIGGVMTSYAKPSANTTVTLPLSEKIIKSNYKYFDIYLTSKNQSIVSPYSTNAPETCSMYQYSNNLYYGWDIETLSVISIAFNGGISTASQSPVFLLTINFLVGTYKPWFFYKIVFHN